MGTTAILPVKRFERAKRRLRPTLGPGSRAALAAAMLADVLMALERSATLETVVVVSGEPAMRRLAQRHGALLVPDLTEKGQSAAALAGLARAAELGCERALLVPADCPVVDSLELDELVARVTSDELEVAIVPDRHLRGTNALLLDANTSFEPLFGPDSLNRHVEQAERHGLRYVVEPVASLALDLDTGDDLVALVSLLDRTPDRAPHTHAVLRQLERTDSLAVPV